jgi:hypothetical protein
MSSTPNHSNAVIGKEFNGVRRSLPDRLLPVLGGVLRSIRVSRPKIAPPLVSTTHGEMNAGIEALSRTLPS